MKTSQRRNMRYQRPGAPAQENLPEIIDVAALAFPEGFDMALVQESGLEAAETIRTAFELSEVQTTGEWNDLPDNTKDFFLKKVVGFVGEVLTYFKADELREVDVREDGVIIFEVGQDLNLYEGSLLQMVEFVRTNAVKPKKAAAKPKKKKAVKKKKGSTKTTK